MRWRDARWLLLVLAAAAVALVIFLASDWLLNVLAPKVP